MTQDLTKEMMEYLDADDLTDEGQTILFKRMGDLEGIDDFLRLLLRKDIIAYFHAPIEAQPLARGAYLRTKWMWSQIKKSRVTKDEALKDFNKKPKRNLTKK